MKFSLVNFQLTNYLFTYTLLVVSIFFRQKWLYNLKLILINFKNLAILIKRRGGRQFKHKTNNLG